MGERKKKKREDHRGSDVLKDNGPVLLKITKNSDRKKGKDKRDSVIMREKVRRKELRAV